MKKLDDAKRRFGVNNFNGRNGNGYQPILEENSTNFPGAARPFIEVADAGDVKGLQARNLRLKMEINRLNEMLNDRDELIDQMRNPKPLKWVAAAVLVGLVFLAHHYGFM